MHVCMSHNLTTSLNMKLKSVWTEIINHSRNVDTGTVFLTSPAIILFWFIIVEAFRHQTLDDKFICSTRKEKKASHLLKHRGSHKNTRYAFYSCNALETHIQSNWCWFVVIFLHQHHAAFLVSLWTKNIACHWNLVTSCIAMTWCIGYIC